MRITRTRALLASLAVHGCVVALAARWLPQAEKQSSPGCELCVTLQIPEPAGGLLAEDPTTEPTEESPLSQPPEPQSEPDTQPVEISDPPSIAQSPPLPPPIAKTIAVDMPATVSVPNKASRSRSAKAAGSSEQGSGSNAGKFGGNRGGGFSDASGCERRCRFRRAKNATSRAHRAHGGE